MISYIPGVDLENYTLVFRTMFSHIPGVELGKLHFRNLERYKDVALAFAKGDF